MGLSTGTSSGMMSTISKIMTGRRNPQQFDERYMTTCGKIPFLSSRDEDNHHGLFLLYARIIRRKTNDYSSTKVQKACSKIVQHFTLFPVCQKNISPRHNK
jgi:hypothetical protein